MVRLVFHQPLRQTEGLLGSLLDLMDVDLPVPDHTTISGDPAILVGVLTLDNWNYQAPAGFSGGPAGAPPPKSPDRQQIDGPWSELKKSLHP